MNKDYNGKPYSKDENAHISLRGDTLTVELTYPEVPENAIKYVIFDQESVRASDGIRLSYDYDRDGYRIEQARRFTWTTEDMECDKDWQEVAFVKAWSRAETDEEEEERLTALEAIR